MKDKLEIYKEALEKIAARSTCKSWKKCIAHTSDNPWEYCLACIAQEALEKGKQSDI